MLTQTPVVGNVLQGPGEERVGAEPGQILCVPAFSPGMLQAFS